MEQKKQLFVLITKKITYDKYNVKSITHQPGIVQWPCKQEAQPRLCSHTGLNLYRESQTEMQREKCVR